MSNSEDTSLQVRELPQTNLFWDEMLATQLLEMVRSDSCPGSPGSGAPDGQLCTGAAHLPLVLSGTKGTRQPADLAVAADRTPPSVSSCTVPGGSRDGGGAGVHQAT